MGPLFTELVQLVLCQNQSLWPEGTGSALIGWSGSHGVEGCKEREGSELKGGPKDEPGWTWAGSQVLMK